MNHRFDLAGSFAGKRFRWLALLLLGTLVLLGAGDDSSRMERLGHQMMCMCGCNQILLECNHVGCTYSDRMRGELTAAIDSGSSDSSVLQTFIEKYGATVLAAPTKEGFNRVAWIMPYAALGLGIGAVVLVARSWRKRPPGPPSSGGPSATGSDLDRLREKARKETEL